MAYKRNYLVVANVTATSPELREALARRAQGGPVSFTLVVPATPPGGGPSAASRQLRDALGALHEQGLEADGEVGDCDPYVAVAEAWDPKRYDEIIVSTLPTGTSKWLHAGLPERIARFTGAPVSHVVARLAKREVTVDQVPAAQERRPALGPLSVLAWGAHKEQ